MDNKKKNAIKWFCIAIALMLISMIGASQIQTSGGKVTVKDLRWETQSGFELSAYLFVPEGVSAKNKAPAIVVSHGMFNNREMQDTNFVELSRRGFVVLAIDMPSHGNSENTPAIGGVLMGMYEAVKMLASLNYVDVDRIGITGHSLGGWSCNTAVSMDNAADKHLISAVLLNCYDAIYVDEKTKNYTNIYGNRDVGIVAAQYDEFFMADTDANGNKTAPRDYVKNKHAQSFLYYGNDPKGKKLCKAETMYHETIDGKDAIRVIYNPKIDHPWSHFSKRSTTATIKFFEKALKAPNPIAPTNQVWQVKEFFNLLGLSGFVIFVVNFTILMLFTQFFSSLRSKEAVAPREFVPGGKKWFWGSIIAGAIFGSVAYLPIMTNVGSFTFFRSPWPQSAPWGVSCWAAACGVFAALCMLASYFFNGKKNGVDLAAWGVKIGIKNLGKTILLALVVVLASFSCVFFAAYFFKTDFRIWVLAVKAFEADKVLVSIFPYAEFFLIYYVAASVAANSFNYNTLGVKDGKREWINTAVVALFNAIPPLAIIAFQYFHFFTTGFVAFADHGSMYIVWLFPVAVILPAATVISRKIYRVTNNPYIGGIVTGLIVTLIICSNTLTWR
jgi:dienelactone hydrolase